MDSESEEDEPVQQKHKTLKSFYKYFRMGTLLVWWVFVMLSFILQKEQHEHHVYISISAEKPYETNILGHMEPLQNLYGVELRGPLENEHVSQANQEGMLVVTFISLADPSNSLVNETRNVWKVNVQSTKQPFKMERLKRAFVLPDEASGYILRIEGKDFEDTIPLEVLLRPHLISTDKSIILASILLLSLYVLIIWEIVDRVFAALLSSTMAIAVLAWLNIRPHIDEIVQWIDIPTIVLLFGMMILVTIFAETGVFDVMAVYAYKLSKGHAWPMIYTICLLTGLLSAFLDNVTMMLLMTPVTIRLCEVMDLNVVNVLIIVTVFSNIGGTMTPVGDPPNVIISNNQYVKDAGVDFMTFTMHMFPVILLCIVTTLIQVRLTYGKNGLSVEPENEQQKLEKELKALKKLKKQFGSISAEEQAAIGDMNEKIKALQEKYKASANKQTFGLRPTSNYIDTLAQMEAMYPVRNKPLLIKSAIALCFAISMFFLHSTPFFAGMSLEWTAILSALLLLILSAPEDISHTIHRVEWATLLFFAALFVMMEALAEMGLIESIGLMTIKLIENVNDSGRLALAIVLILWISGISSAFVDNIPVTQMMIKICIHVYNKKDLNLALTPLIWSLALGACLGGNGTIIGASANVVCAGIAAQHGYKFSFMDFFKVAFPLMVNTMVVSTAYLFFCHIAIKWH